LQDTEVRPISVLDLFQRAPGNPRCNDLGSESREDDD